MTFSPSRLSLLACLPSSLEVEASLASCFSFRFAPSSLSSAFLFRPCRFSACCGFLPFLSSVGSPRVISFLSALVGPVGRSAFFCCVLGYCLNVGGKWWCCCCYGFLHLLGVVVSFGFASSCRCGSPHFDSGKSWFSVLWLLSVVGCVGQLPHLLAFLASCFALHYCLRFRYMHVQLGIGWRLLFLTCPHYGSAFFPLVPSNLFWL